jgi:hypothetical protein
MQHKKNKTWKIFVALALLIGLAILGLAILFVFKLILWLITWAIQTFFLGH